MITQSRGDEEKAQRALRLFSEVSAARTTWGTHCEEIAQLIWPERRNTFFFGNVNVAGSKRTDKQIDSQGMIALQRFSAIVDSLLTPRNQTWHLLEADDPYVMKDRATRIWFEEVTRLVFKWRYAPSANYSGQNHSSWKQLGAFGLSPLFIDDLEGAKGLRYKDIPAGQLYLFENHQGLVNGFMRTFELTAEQAFGVQSWKGKLDDRMLAAREKQSQGLFKFLHWVYERTDDYEEGRLDAKGKKYASCYICIDSKILLSEGGYTSFPLACGRYTQAADEVWGRSPAMDVLPALKTKNAQKGVFLKQGHRAADPVLLSADDGIMNFSLRPGAMNPGGMSPDGKMLVGVLPTGNIQINEKMMDMEGAIINDAFLVSLFQMLTETPRMTATEVIERVNEKGILLAPSIGRQQDERLGPQIDRELDVLASQGILPPMPPRLREAGGAYSVKYTSPLSRAARAQEAAGFMRVLEVATNVTNVTQDPSHLDTFSFDRAYRGIADIQAVPESWLATDDEIEAKRQGRAQAAKAQQEIQAAPAAAAMMKARAAAAETQPQ